MGNGTKLIKIREKEYKKLSDYKVHRKQPYWEVIKKIIEEKEVKNARKKGKGKTRSKISIS